MNVRPKVSALVAGAMLTTVSCLTSSTPAVGQEGDGADGPVAPLGDDGMWLVDAEERVVLLHGVNEVYKDAPYYPAADGFGAADAEFLAEHGFNVVRLGVEFQGLMPEPGEIDHDYVENIATSVDDLAAEGIFVLLDFHQDGYGPEYTGNGFPSWMSIDDGEFNNPDTSFPLYYIQNPAMQRAFQNFWTNREGPDGIGLQDHFIDGLTAVVERFADEPYVVGYEPINEPWPGHVWEPCIDAAGCTDLEQELLTPFYEKVTTAVRDVTDTQQVWVEPFVLFNFGQGPTSIPGSDSDNVLSWHSYALDVAGEEGVAAFAREAAERDSTPAVATEFGATTDPVMTNRLLDQIEGGLMGWMFWAYNEQIVPGYGGRDDDVPRIDQVPNMDLFTALVRPYPTAVTGTPAEVGFDHETLTYAFSYETTGPSGQDYPDGLETVLSVPEFRYPDGYTVEVVGAEVTSEEGSDTLTLVNEDDADEVTVCVVPAGSDEELEQCDDVLAPPPDGSDPGDDDNGGGTGTGSPTGTTPAAMPVAGQPSFTG
jgi:endoglycosylceramidase